MNWPIFLSVLLVGKFLYLPPDIALRLIQEKGKLCLFHTMRVSTRQPNHELWTARTLQGISAKQVASILRQKDTDQIYRWEKGSKCPSLQNALLLAYTYNKPVEELFKDLLQELTKESEPIQAIKNTNQRSEFLGPSQ